MANKKTQKRNKKRKQEQMRTTPAASSVEPERKKINWRKIFAIIGLIIVAVFVFSAMFVKFKYNENLADSAAEASASPTSAVTATASPVA